MKKHRRIKLAMGVIAGSLIGLTALSNLKTIKMVLLIGEEEGYTILPTLFGPVPVIVKKTI